MSEITQILITSSLTILGGVLIFSVTKLLESLYFETLRKINELRGEISCSLTFHANKFGNSNTVDQEEIKEASNELRRLGSELRSQTYGIKDYRILTCFSSIVPNENLLGASIQLIGLSNSIFRKDYDVIDERKGDIKKKLNIQD